MQRFVARQNIQHFEDMLRTAKTEAERETLRKLLAEEEEKLRQEEEAQRTERR
ncbi:MAG TPA: hypothetical protein VG939_04415 [Caulobacteraceae bacterium]|nr:hypothetical protein [Caulobacteraceae bacterium]